MPEDLLAKDYQPRSELVVPEHHVPRAKFPVIDAHNHVSDPGFGWLGQDLQKRLQELDDLNVAAVVNLSGGSGDVLNRNIEALDRLYLGRFITYCNLDFSGFGTSAWTDRAARQVLADVQSGARGLKIFKGLGLVHRDETGKLISPDDPRLDDVWDAAGEASVPVTIHVADPVAFFRPLDRFNERWDELHAFPDWHFYGPQFPSFESLIEALYRVIERHPKTNFITAHVGCYSENLAFVDQMMERYPNLYTDIAARIAELGRAPYSARAWFIKRKDRILFGTDHGPSAPMYQVHFRFLETADEYFSYDPFSAIPGQGRWRIYGLYLPDDVLKLVYRDNAARLFRM